MSWRNAILKLLLGLALGIAVAALTAFNVLLAWVATGPRSLDMFTPYLELALDPPDHKYSVSIGQTWLIWDGWKHPIDIRLRNVKVLTSQRHTYSTFPEISLGVDLFALMGGHIYPTSLTISHPVISLFQNADRSISFGMQPETAPEAAKEAATPQAPATAEVPSVPFAAIMAPLMTPDEHSALRDLRLVSIVNADLTLSNQRKGVFFKTSGANFTFKRNHEGLHAFASASIAYGNYQSQLAAEFTKPRKSSIINGEVDVSRLMPGVLADLFAENTLLSAMKFPISGKAMVQADMDGAVQKADFTIDGGKGTIDTDQLDSPVPVERLHVEGRLGHNTANHENTLEIGKLSADLDGALIDASGTVSLNHNGPEIHAKIAAQNIAAKNVHIFWPPRLAPITREWVTANITEGAVSLARVQLNIASGDLARPILPKADIDALVDIKGATIRYMSRHPDVTGVDGKIHIDGMSLDASLDSGHTMKDTKLSEGRVFIADLNPDNPYIKVSFTADSTARDAIHLLDLPPLEKAKKLNLQADAATGKVKAHAALGFTFFAPRDAKGNEVGEPDIDYDVTAELTGVSQPGFMNKFDVQNAGGTLTVDKKALEFKGAGGVNGASASKADVRYLFMPERGLDTFIDVTATAPVSVLPRFGYPSFAALKGLLGVKASVRDGKDIESTQATIDLTNASITLPQLGISKAEKEAASLDITAAKKDDAATIPSFRFKGRGIDIQGSAELSRDLSGVKRVHLDRLLAGGNDLTRFDYENNNGGYRVDMRGNSLDVSPWMGSKSIAGESHFSFEHFPPLQLQMDVSQVIFDKGHELQDVKGMVNCDVIRCEGANIKGVTPDSKPFSFRILHNPAGRRQLSLHAQSAGQFLRSVNLFDGMEGGDLTIIGNYTEATGNKGSMLRGRVDINEHTIKNAPILAKILTLASLTGIFDTLQGNGIYFSRLSIPFTLDDDVITIKNAKTHGDAIGLTADGTITFPKGTLDIEGTIVPSYSLNHVLGNVPIIGNVLTGGEGQGVFAARYSVTGTQQNPQVSVNPLSMLTPGFLRGLFDILDTSPKQEDEDGSQE